MGSREILQSDFLVLNCESTWGAYSYILTGCTDRQEMEEICESVSGELEEEHGQGITFSINTLTEIVSDMEESGLLDEIKDGDYDGLDGIDHSLLIPEKLLLPENVTLLYGVLELYFNTGYENGIISGYFEGHGIPVLLVS